MTNSCTPNTHRKYLSLCPQAPFSLSIIARNTRSNLKVQSRVFIKLTQSFTWRARSVARERQLRWRYDALVIARRVRTVCAGRRAVERTRGNRERPPQRLRAALCVGLIDRARPLASTQNADLLPCHAMPCHSHCVPHQKAFSSAGTKRWSLRRPHTTIRAHLTSDRPSM